MRREQLTGHPDQVRWNAKYAEDPPVPRPEWCLNPGEPARLLPPGFGVIEQADRPDQEHGEDGAAPGTAIRRSLLARRLGSRERRPGPYGRRAG